ncbi:MAG TPA: cation:proton antiporter [Ignavibacteria bacterium]|nr:cation:proton antiporter [Ignavibacteria bacterium]
MHNILFLQDLAVVMLVAGIATVIFRQFKQPVVLGYIVAGVIIGPHTPPFELISDSDNINTLAELGVIFLMFSLGLEFSLRKLKEVGGTALIAASIEIIIMIWAGYELGQLFGWNQMDSIFLGAIISISSTTIIVKALESQGKTKEKFSQLIFGILIIEDILAILIIAMLSGFATKGEIAVKDVSMIVLKLCAFMGILLASGLIIVPRLLNYVAKFKSNEMLLVTVVGICFGVSLLTVKLGYSVALGAFLIGAVVAETRQITKIETLMHPLRDLFSAVFFVSIGLLINPAVIVEYIFPVLVISVVVIIGQVNSCALGCFISGKDMKTSVKVGMSLGQIGEFSFIIAALGLTLNVTSDFLYPIVVAVSALTTFSTPYSIRYSDNVFKYLEAITPRPLRRTMEVYNTWINEPARVSHNVIGRKILRKVSLQIGINLLIVTGIFISFVFLHENISSFLQNYLGGIEVTKALLWIMAMIISFPSLIAIWKKTQAAGMVIAELSTSKTAEPKKSIIRGVISKTFFAIGTVLLLIIIILLSSALLPSSNMLILAIILISVTGAFIYQSSVNIYAHAQTALKETFLQPADPLPKTEIEFLQHPLLKDLKLESVNIEPETVGVKKLISELQLRSITGTTIIGIERDGKSIVNPEPDEELAEFDKLLLLGYDTQINAAIEFLNTKR